MRLPRNRQNLQRIDRHERIVVGRTGKSREVPLLLLWGRKDDISGIKARGAFVEMAATIQECRSSGQSVKKWCGENGISVTTYYRWERAVLSKAEDAMRKQETPAFAELPVPKQEWRNVSECSATVRIGDGYIEFHQEMSPELIRSLIKALRSC